MKETIVGPFGARQLSDDEWNAQTGKMFSMHLKKDVEPYSKWQQIHFEFVAKYCLNRCTGWFYHRDSHYIFGVEEDYYLVKMWVTNNRMIHEKSEFFLDADSA
jgi:hypothetical protein